MKEYLISAQAAVEEIARRDTTDGNVKVFSGQEIISILHSIPQAVPRMRGRWMESDTDGFVCSVCRNGYKTQPTLMGKPMFEFCPCCGADMREGQDE